MIQRAKARALANLALVKYFGKRDLALNLPAAGSLSLTLEPLATETLVEFDSDLTADDVLLNGHVAPAKFQTRVTRFLDRVRQLAGVRTHAKVTTDNRFPTAAGLASSASGFAALAKASSAALALNLTDAELSALARQGSGSACRSICDGIAVWHAGSNADGTDSFAESIASPTDWDLRVVIGIAESGPKAIGSTEAMEHTRKTSPYYNEWIETTKRDLNEAVAAIASRDFQRLGHITEHNALAMHAAALSARPSIVYWNPSTIAALKTIQTLRKDGLPTYFTCDAGPQPKALCHPQDANTVSSALKAVPGIQRTIQCRLGKGAAKAHSSAPIL